MSGKLNSEPSGLAKGCAEVAFAAWITSPPKLSDLSRLFDIAGIAALSERLNVLQAASSAIVRACEENAAPTTLSYALAQVEKVELSSDLIADLVAAQEGS